jgi:hypothetical protein
MEDLDEVLKRLKKEFNDKFITNKTKIDLEENIQ